MLSLSVLVAWASTGMIRHVTRACRQAVYGCWHVVYGQGHDRPHSASCSPLHLSPSTHSHTWPCVCVCGCHYNSLANRQSVPSSSHSWPATTASPHTNFTYTRLHLQSVERCFSEERYTVNLKRILSWCVAQSLWLRMHSVQKKPSYSHLFS